MAKKVAIDVSIKIDFTKAKADFAEFVKSVKANKIDIGINEEKIRKTIRDLRDRIQETKIVLKDITVQFDQAQVSKTLSALKAQFKGIEAKIDDAKLNASISAAKQRLKTFQTVDVNLKFANRTALGQQIRAFLRNQLQTQVPNLQIKLGAGVVASIAGLNTRLVNATANAQALKVVLASIAVNPTIVSLMQAFNKEGQAAIKTAAQLKKSVAQISGKPIKIETGSAQTDLQNLAGSLLNLAGAREAIDRVVFGFAEFQTQLAGTGRVLNITGKELELIGEQLVNLANSTGQSVRSVLDLAEASAQLGVSKENLIGFVSQVNNIAIALKINQEEAARAFDSFQRLFKIKPDNIQNFADAFSKVADSSNLSARQLVTFVTFIAPVAAQFGIASTEALAFVTALGELGVSAEVTSTGIQKIATSLTKNTAEIAKIVGQSQEQFENLLKNNPTQAILQFSDAFNKLDTATQISTKSLLKLNDVRVGRVLTLLSKNTERVTEVLNIGNEAFKENSQVTNLVARNIVLLSATFARLSGTVEQLTRSAFAPFAETLTDMLKAVIAFVNNNRELLVGVTQLALVFAGVVAAISSVAVALFSLSTVIGLVVGGIGFLTGAFTSLTLIMAKAFGATSLLVTAMEGLSLALLALETLAVAHPIGAFLAIIAVGAVAVYAAVKAFDALNVSTQKLSKSTPVGIEKLESSFDKLGSAEKKLISIRDSIDDVSRSMTSLGDNSDALKNALNNTLSGDGASKDFEKTFNTLLAGSGRVFKEILKNQFDALKEANSVQGKLTDEGTNIVIKQTRERVKGINKIISDALGANEAKAKGFLLDDVVTTIEQAEEAQKKLNTLITRVSAEAKTGESEAVKAAAALVAGTKDIVADAERVLASNEKSVAQIGNTFNITESKTRSLIESFAKLGISAKELANEELAGKLADIVPAGIDVAEFSNNLILDLDKVRNSPEIKQALADVLKISTAELEDTKKLPSVDLFRKIADQGRDAFEIVKEKIAEGVATAKVLDIANKAINESADESAKAKVEKIKEEIALLKEEQELSANRLKGDGLTAKQAIEVRSNLNLLKQGEAEKEKEILELNKKVLKEEADYKKEVREAAEEQKKLLGFQTKGLELRRDEAEAAKDFNKVLKLTKEIEAQKLKGNIEVEEARRGEKLTKPELDAAKASSDLNVAEFNQKFTEKIKKEQEKSVDTLTTNLAALDEKATDFLRKSKSTVSVDNASEEIRAIISEGSKLGEIIEQFKDIAGKGLSSDLEEQFIQNFTDRLDGSIKQIQEKIQNLVNNLRELKNNFRDSIKELEKQERGSIKDFQKNLQGLLEKRDEILGKKPKRKTKQDLVDEVDVEIQELIKKRKEDEEAFQRAVNQKELEFKKQETLIKDQLAALRQIKADEEESRAQNIAEYEAVVREGVELYKAEMDKLAKSQLDLKNATLASQQAAVANTAAINALSQAILNASAAQLKTAIEEDKKQAEKLRAEVAVSDKEIENAREIKNKTGEGLDKTKDDFTTAKFERDELRKAVASDVALLNEIKKTRGEIRTKGEEVKAIKRADSGFGDKAFLNEEEQSKVDALELQIANLEADNASRVAQVKKDSTKFSEEQIARIRNGGKDGGRIPQEEQENNIEAQVNVDRNAANDAALKVIKLEKEREALIQESNAASKLETEASLKRTENLKKADEVEAKAQEAQKALTEVLAARAATILKKDTEEKILEDARKAAEKAADLIKERKEAEVPDTRVDKPSTTVETPDPKAGELGDAGEPGSAGVSGVADSLTQARDFVKGVFGRLDNSVAAFAESLQSLDLASLESSITSLDSAISASTAELTNLIAIQEESILSMTGLAEQVESFASTVTGKVGEAVEAANRATGTVASMEKSLLSLSVDKGAT